MSQFFMFQTGESNEVHFLGGAGSPSHHAAAVKHLVGPKFHVPVVFHRGGLQLPRISANFDGDSASHLESGIGT